MCVWVLAFVSTKLSQLFTIYILVRSYHSHSFVWCLHVSVLRPRKDDDGFVRMANSQTIEFTLCCTSPLYIGALMLCVRHSKVTVTAFIPPDTYSLVYNPLHRHCTQETKHLCTKPSHVVMIRMLSVRSRASLFGANIYPDISHTMWRIYTYMVSTSFIAYNIYIL